MQDALDAIVVGGGIIGRLTAWHFAKSGKSTLLLEKDRLNLAKGSSRGLSRMFGETFIRDIYYRLACQSRLLWKELEYKTGEKLLYLNGSLDIVSGSGARRSIKELTSVLISRKIPFEVFDGDDLRQEYPQWERSSRVRAVYSSNGGILQAERCMNASILAAQKCGALIKEQSRVVNIESCRSATVLLKMSSGETYRTRKLVLAAGPWAVNILKRLGVNLPLRVSQEQTVYFVPHHNAHLFEPENFPVWEWETEGGQFIYGFPIFEKNGIKVAFHSDGHYLKNLGEFQQKPYLEVIKRLHSFLKKHIPDAAGEAFGATTCMYTNTPDNDFVIDTIPGMPQITFFTGCSGHAFHCAPALGKTLVELATDGKTTLDISPFSLKRF